MHPLLITFSLLCCVQLSSLHAQTLSNYQRDSICIYELGEKAFAMKSSAPDSALLLADQALELSKAIDDSTSQMSLLRIKGVIHYGQFRYAAALTYFEQAYAIAQRIGKSEGRLLINLGNVYYRRDEFKIALAQYKQALQLSEQKDTLVWMDAITNMGSVYDVLGDFERSIDYFNQALQLQQAIGNQLAQLPTISNIGFIHRRRNELEKSLETYETGIALAKTLNKHGWIAHFYAQIGASYQNKDYHFQALKAFQTALTVRDSLAQTRNVALLLRRIGETYHESGNQEAGLTYYQRSLALYEDLDDLHGKATVLNAIGKNLLKQARSAEAKAALHRSIATYRAGKISKHIMRPYYHLVLLYQQNGPLDSARYYLNAAYELAAEINKQEIIALSLMRLGEMAQDAGKLAQAILYYQQALAATKQEGNRKEELEVLGRLYEVSKQQRQPNLSLSYLEQQQVIRDSLFNEENLRKIAQLQAKYAFDQEKAAIERQNELEKRELDEKIQRQRR